MSDLTAKFTALEEQLAAQAVIIQGYTDEIEDKLDFINTQLDTMTLNNAANTKALLSALGQTGACFPCPTPSIVVPTVGTTPISVSPEHCQRSQAMIKTIHDILTAMDTMQSYNVVGTFSVLNDAISEIIGGIAAGDTVPLPSFPETVNIVGDYISYAGERLFSGVGLVEQFDTISEAATIAIASASDAETAQSLYNGIVDGSDVSNGAKLLFKAVGYNALWTYFFDPSSEPDLSAFDGGACGITLHGVTACTNFASAVVTTAGHDYNLVQTLPIYSGYAFATEGDFNGYSIRLISIGGSGAMHIFRWHSGSGPELLADQTVPAATYTFSETTDAIMLVGDADDSHAMAFVVEVCPPA